MILKTKEERIEFLSGLEIGKYFEFYMINQDELENEDENDVKIEHFWVRWAWGYFDRRTSANKGDLSFLECDGSGDPIYRNYSYVHVQGKDAYEYILNYIWSDDKLELEKETRKYKKALEVRNSVLDELSKL